MGKNHEDKRKPRHAAQPPDTEEMSTAEQLALTAAGAAGSALLGAYLTRKGWAPKMVSGAIAALGALLAGIGENEALRAVGAGAMSGSGAQLVLMLFAEHEDKKQVRSSDNTSIAARAAASVTGGDAANANAAPRVAQAAAS